MSATILFFVAGEPKGEPRPRAFAKKFGDKWSARVYSAGTAENWKTLIAFAAKKHRPKEPMLGPVRVDIRFYFPRPKSHYRTGKHAGQLRGDAPSYCITKPDRDNADKAALDALTVLGFWRDDAQVCDGRVIKMYADGGPPGAWIQIESLEKQ